MVEVLVPERRETVEAVLSGTSQFPPDKMTLAGTPAMRSEYYFPTMQARTNH